MCHMRVYNIEQRDVIYDIFRETTDLLGNPRDETGRPSPQTDQREVEDAGR
jgi:hypothetical protein